jgi:hypothetical protein
MSMNDEEDPDEERGQLSSEKRPKRKNRLVNPITLKVILTIGPMLAKILSVGIELVKLLKD